MRTRGHPVCPKPLGGRAPVLCVFSLLILDDEIQAFRRCFLCFIAPTSGLKAPHLTKSITPSYAFGLLLCSLLHFLHLRAPRPLCVAAPPSAILLVNYLLYFVSELMSDIKRGDGAGLRNTKMASSLLS